MIIQAENRITLLEEEKTEAEDVARDKTEELSETIGNKIIDNIFLGIIEFKNKLSNILYTHFNSIFLLKHV